MKTVGIIGAGAAGLCALRHVLSSANMVPVVWEQSGTVGGTWVYTDQLDKDENGLPVHSSMYKNLRTNLPKEVMSFPDFPFPSGGTSFIHHTDVLKYLEDYTDHFNLKPHIKFEHVVQEVEPSRPGEQDTDWLVTVRDLNTDTLSTTLCHALLVCNGHYSVPYVPVLDNIDQFRGSVLHSHSYRDPADYAGKTVMVLGASASGIDISIELSSVAKKVYLSHNMPIPLPAELPPNLEQTAGVTGVKKGSGDTFVLRDGSEVVADAILYCTGYYYVFPFLSRSCGVTVKDNQVWPLYRHLIHCDYPSMAFVGIPTKICPFPFFDIQARYSIACLEGLVALPSPSDMRAATERDIRTRIGWGHAVRHYHKMVYDHQQWDYITLLQDELREAEQAAISAGRPWVLGTTDDDVPRLKGVWDLVLPRVKLQTAAFKEYTYTLRTVSGSAQNSPCSTRATGSTQNSPGSTNVVGRAQNSPGSKRAVGRAKNSPCSTKVAGRAQNSPCSKMAAGCTQNSPGSTKFPSFGNTASNSVVVEERLRGRLTRPKLDAAWYACTRLLPLACRNFVPFVRYFSRMLYYRVKKRFFAS